MLDILISRTDRYSIFQDYSRQNPLEEQMELVSLLPSLSLISHIHSLSLEGHSEFILLYILPVLDKQNMINLTHEPLRVASSWLAPQIIIDPLTVSCRYWSNTYTRISVIWCTVPVRREAVQLELNHALFCNKYFEVINNMLLMVHRASVNIQIFVVLSSLHVHCIPACLSSVFLRHKCFAAPHWDKTGSDNDMD